CVAWRRPVARNSPCPGRFHPGCLSLAKNRLWSWESCDGGIDMARLHQRGVDLLLNVQMALDHLDELTPQEVREVLQETEIVLRDLLARDVPREPPDTQAN